MMRGKRVLSFGAGPGLWPDEVLARASELILPGSATGLSPLEMSHRGPEYGEFHARALASLRRLLGAGAEHEVLLLPGGATMQFAMAPANLIPVGGLADYLVTGRWARLALINARKWAHARVVASSEEEAFAEIPARETWALDERAVYLHLTSNNTVAGTQLPVLPEGLNCPMVIDASSDLLTRELPLDGVGMLYAGAQKNLGPAGLSMVLIRKELLETMPRSLPAMLSYRDHAARGSLLNTPPTLLIVLLSLMLDWVEGEGGVPEMCRRADERAEIVYSALRSHPGVYSLHARAPWRSRTNVVFRLVDSTREGDFLAQAKERDLGGLEGHRSVGGLRASLYAPMPVDGARRLASLLDDFAGALGREGA